MYVRMYVFIVNMHMERNINIDQYKSSHNANCYVCCFYISAFIAVFIIMINRY